MPHTDADSAFEEILQHLPPDLLEMAGEYKAFRRARKIKTPQQLLRAILSYCGLDSSLREVAAQHTLLVEPITDSSVADRLKACQPWIEACITKMLSVATGVAALGRRVLANDGTIITCPGRSGANFRLHLSVDLATAQIADLRITDTRTSERLTQTQVRAGDILLADRNYCTAASIDDVVTAEADVVVRLNPHAARVIARDCGTLVDWRAWLDGHAIGTIQTLPIVLESSDGRHKVDAFVHAYRLDEQQAEAARRRCRRHASKKGVAARKSTPSDLTLLLCGFVLVLTTLDPAEVSAEAILQLYRCRWQVELVIKRLKSLLGADQLRARASSSLGPLWMRGKLLYALLIERACSHKVVSPWEALTGARTRTPWRVWTLMAQYLAPRISGALFWRPELWDAALQALSERPRRRPLQRLPSIVAALLVPPDRHALKDGSLL